MAVTPGNEPLEKLPPKSGHGARKGVMTSSDPIVEGPRYLLMHKDYAVKEVESFDGYRSLCLVREGGIGGVNSVRSSTGKLSSLASFPLIFFLFID